MTEPIEQEVSEKAEHLEFLERVVEMNRENLRQLCGLMLAPALVNVLENLERSIVDREQFRFTGSLDEELERAQELVADVWLKRKKSDQIAAAQQLDELIDRWLGSPLTEDAP